MFRPIALALCVALAVSVFPGCRNNNQQLVEMELRARDIQYREALEELGKAESRNNALWYEMEGIRKGSKLPPEAAAQAYGLRRIVLGRGTGGLDDDNLPGDEALQIFLEPRDSDDHTIKAPGVLQIQALEINQQGLKVPLSTWTVEPDKLRASWKQGLLSTGYNLVLPFKNSPQSENLRVVARFVLADGRIFETDKDIKVRIIPGAARHGPPAAEFPPPPNLVVPGALETGQPDPVPPQLDPLGGLQQTTSKSAAIPASNWQPVSLEGAVQLGRPIPLAEPVE